MDLKNIAANFNSFSRLLDDEIRSRIPESGQIDIEPEDKCVFHDDNDDRPEHRIVKAVFLSSDGTGYGLITEDEYCREATVCCAECCLSIDDKYNILRAVDDKTKPYGKTQKPMVCLGVVVGRPINGISLNGLEYLLDEDGKIEIFPSLEEAHQVLINGGVWEEDLDEFEYRKVMECPNCKQRTFVHLNENVTGCTDC